MKVGGNGSRLFENKAKSMELLLKCMPKLECNGCINDNIDV
jgi:hypothetical protein